MAVSDRLPHPYREPELATPGQAWELMNVMMKFTGSQDPTVQSHRVLPSFPGAALPVFLSRHFERAPGPFDYTLRVACNGVHGAVLLSRGNDTIGDQYLRFDAVPPTEDNPAGITRGTAWVPPAKTSAAPTLMEICESPESNSGMPDLGIASGRLPVATMHEVSALIGVVRRHIE